MNRYDAFRSGSLTRLPAMVFAVALLGGVLLLGESPREQSADWPRNTAQWTLDIFKSAGTQPDDLYWLELTTPGATAGVSLRVTSPTTLERPAAEFIGLQVRYLVHGVPVSPWLRAPFTFSLTLDNPALDGLPDGVHDLSLDVQHPDRANFKPRPVYLHLSRRRAVSPLVPILGRDVQYGDYGVDWGPGVVYVRYADAKRVGHPVDPLVTPFKAPPYEANTWQEEMSPHTDLFRGVQMWWEDPDGTKFIRALVPKWDEDHRGLRVLWKQERFPFIDGPRGIGWTGTYTGGQVDTRGNFVFVEAGGPLRVMKPDGELVTVAGWRVKPGKDPIWLSHPVSVIRQNMELRGTWTSGQYADKGGFRTPLDVAIDPTNDRTYYVAGYEDHCIWKVVASADWSTSAVSVFAGDPGHSKGFADGAGASARFNGPSSVVFDPTCDCLYVADQDNDAIRRITRGGVVSTFAGRPGQLQRMTSAGIRFLDEWTYQASNRGASKFTVTTAEAAAGKRPDVYLPQTVRVDSRGRVFVLDNGFGSIRRIDPRTFETVDLVTLTHRYWPGAVDGTGGSRGWAWFDIDRWGNAGPLDGIYFGVFQQSGIDGEVERHPNEAFGWCPPTGRPCKWIFNDWDPFPDGWGPVGKTDPPHYFWTVAIDPRGAVYFAGSGEHGVTRLRTRKPGDVEPKSWPDYMRGKELWRDGLTPTTPSPALKFGYEGHNYLGFADAWSYDGATDSTLAAAFEFPASMDGEARRIILNFLRLNAQRNLPIKPSPPSFLGRPRLPMRR